MTTRTPPVQCWHCRRVLDAADAVEGFAEPTQGAVSLCMYCGAIGVFGPDLVLLKPTKELLDGMQEDREFMTTFAQFQWARQFLMLKVSLLGPDAP